MKITPVILAGGVGTRLWPLSSEYNPKQFHDLTGHGTLLKTTLKRLVPLNPDFCIIATSKKYEEMSKKEIENSGLNGEVLIEPSPKNTAPAVLYATIFLLKIYDDSIMLVLPADHYIQRNDVFNQTIEAALEQAKRDLLVTIGIKPKSPETGYGYIKAGKGNGNIFKVESFVEKPDRKTAERYLNEGNYFWNAGIFVWKTSTIVSCFKKLMPNLYNTFSPLMELKDDMAGSDDIVHKIKENIFSSIDPISIDYGIMEKADNKVVIPADLGWTDLGNWNSMDELLKPDENNNRSNKTNSIFVSSKNCSIFTEGKTIALVGVENLTVVESDDNILVMNKDSNQEVKNVVDIIKKRNNG